MLSYEETKKLQQELKQELEALRKAEKQKTVSERKNSKKKAVKLPGNQKVVKPRAKLTMAMSYFTAPTTLTPKQFEAKHGNVFFYVTRLFQFFDADGKLIDTETKLVKRPLENKQVFDEWRGKVKMFPDELAEFFEVRLQHSPAESMKVTENLHGLPEVDGVIIQDGDVLVGGTAVYDVIRGQVTRMRNKPHKN